MSFNPSIMKYAPLRTVACKCDVCHNEADYSADLDTHLMDRESGLVVCNNCQMGFVDDIEDAHWLPVEDMRINYKEEEYEPDYDND